MTNDTSYEQDDKTVLLDRQDQSTASAPLTDGEASPRIEQLQERVVYAARLHSPQAFNTGLNPLVAAAAGLLSALVRIRHSREENLTSLRERLTDALKLFESRALQEGMETSQVMAARYVLCTVIDEAIVSTSWGEQGDWAQNSLLSSFHNETFGGEKFFQLLERLSKNPVRHLSMLELMYLCLSLGFEGKYRLQPRGGFELEAIRDALYRQIRQLRGDVARELSPNWKGLGGPRHGLVRIVPVWMVAVFTVFCLAMMYSGFAWVLGGQRDLILQAYLPSDPTVVQPRP